MVWVMNSVSGVDALSSYAVSVTGGLGLDAALVVE